MGYELIYADPPWSYVNTASNGAATDHYGTMSITDLKRLPVWNLADDNSVLAMWYTGNHVKEAIALADAWGFTIKTMKGFTWIKLNQLAEKHINKAFNSGQVKCFADLMAILNKQTRMNGGNYTRANSEDCLIAVRGSGLERVSAKVKQVIYSPLGEHSQKPAEARDKLEQLYGNVRKIELFSRCSAPGWDHWGNQAPHSAVELINGAFRAKG